MIADNVCRPPAEVLDEQAGGMLCRECAEAKRRRAEEEAIMRPETTPRTTADEIAAMLAEDTVAFWEELQQRRPADADANVITEAQEIEVGANQGEIHDAELEPEEGG